jgi:hypothetical protein
MLASWKCQCRKQQTQIWILNPYQTSRILNSASNMIPVLWYDVQEQLWLIWRASAVILRTGFCSEILRSFRLRKTLECELQTALVPIFYLGKLYRVCVLSKVCRYFPSVTIVLQLLMKIKTRASSWLKGSDVTARFAEVMTFIRVTEHYIFLCGRSVSVGDPDPQDPHVFGPPGSGSISRRYRAGSGSGSRSSFFSHKCVERTEMMPTK